MSKDKEIEMADCIENMLQKDVFTSNEYEIRREGKDLLPKERGLERHRLQLFVKEGPSKTAREITNVDALVINKEKKIVELILEYEVDTNPKNIAGNFIAPFIADQYESNFSQDKNIYLLSPEHTVVLVIACLPEKRLLNAQGQAPLQKGTIVRKSLMAMKKKIYSESKINNGEIIVGDDLEQITEEVKSILWG